MSDLFVGSTIAGCRLDAVAGRGGMGVVYRATQLALNRTVALKAIAPALAEDEAYRERFARESHLAASIEHPNVIPVYEAGERDGTLYLIMRWVEGTDLRALLHSEGRLEPGRAIRILRPVASALEAAHRRGLVHRDVKPANVLIAHVDGERQEHVYLTDFGIAKRSGGQSLTRTGVLVGTIDYTAPERIEGVKATPASDIYAFGCMLFETLSGHVPYPRPTDIAKLHAHLNEPVASLTDAQPDVPEVLAQITEKAMAKRPEDRYASAAELAAALDDALGELEETTPHTATTTVAPRGRRPLWPAIAGAALLVAGIIVAIVASSSGGGGKHPSSVPLTSTTTHSATIPTANTGLPSLHGGGLTRGNQIMLPETPVGLAADGRRAWAIAPGRLLELSSGGTRPALTFTGQPTNVAVDSRGRVWMTGVGTTGVTVFDPSTSHQTSIQAGEAPNLIAMSATAAWLARAGATAVTRVPLSGGGSPQTIPVTRPIAALGAANGRIWVAPSSGAVSVLGDDGTRNDLPGPVIPNDTVGVASSNGVWFLSTSLTRVDPRASKAVGGTYAVHGDQAPVGPDPAGIGALAHDNSVWVLTRGDKTLRRVASGGADNNQIVARVVFPGTPGHLAVGDHILWVDVPATKTIYPISF